MHVFHPHATTANAGSEHGGGVVTDGFNSCLLYTSLARDSGIGGVICSPLETTAIRAACGPEFRLVTPGIRPHWAGKHDQRRVTTPGEAVRGGADYIVVGRAICLLYTSRCV